MSDDKETGYPDGFVVPYVGRVYDEPEPTIFSMFGPPPEPVGDAYEVLSVGMEAAFGGRYGGLQGHGRWKPDEDHRAFVLGVLATL